MKNKVSAKRGIMKPASRPLTEDKFQFYFESLKDMIMSTVQASETVIRKDISVLQEDVSILKKDVSTLKRDVSMLQVAVTEHSSAIKRLDGKVDNVRTELKEEIQSVRTELKEDMRQMEGRLSEKIDGHSARLDNHEIRISAIEQG